MQGEECCGNAWEGGRGEQRSGAAATSGAQPLERGGDSEGLHAAVVLVGNQHDTCRPRAHTRPITLTCRTHKREADPTRFAPPPPSLPLARLSHACFLLDPATGARMSHPGMSAGCVDVGCQQIEAAGKRRESGGAPSSRAASAKGKRKRPSPTPNPPNDTPRAAPVLALQRRTTWQPLSATRRMAPCKRANEWQARHTLRVTLPRTKAPAAGATPHARTHAPGRRGEARRRGRWD